MVHTLSRARHDRGTASASVSHHPLIRYNRQSRRRGYYPVHPHTFFSTLNSVGSRRIIDAGIHRRDAKWHLAETDFHPPIQSGHRRLRRRRSTHAGGGARSKEACGPSLACKRSPSFRVENSCTSVVQPDRCAKSHTVRPPAWRGKPSPTHVHRAGDH